MSLEERRQYRREAAEYLRRSGSLSYNRLLTVMIVLGALGFVAFGYFADPRFPKHKSEGDTVRQHSHQPDIAVGIGAWPFVGATTIEWPRPPLLLLQELTGLPQADLRHIGSAQPCRAGSQAR